MPSLSQIPLDLALIAGRAVFLVFCFVLASIAFTRWRRACEHNVDLFFQQNTTLLQRLMALEEQLAATQRQLTEVTGRFEGEQRRTAAPATTSAAPSYQIAIRLARSGAPREELMSSCGLTRQEAELVQRLHAPARHTKLAAAG